jgi:hypothetical protein
VFVFAVAPGPIVALRQECKKLARAPFACSPIMPLRAHSWREKLARKSALFCHLQTQPGSSGGLLADKLFAAQSEIIKKKFLLRLVYNRKKRC